jgi:ABC-type nitrate/sulfonate/bicarbonate transport system substrate-binding protein
VRDVSRPEEAEGCNGESPHWSVVATLGLVGLCIAQPGYAQEAPADFHVGYQKAGLLSVAKEQGVFERRLKSLGVESVKWLEFELGPPMMDAISKGVVDFGWVGDAPAIIAQSAGAKFVLCGMHARVAARVVGAGRIRYPLPGGD